MHDKSYQQYIVPFSLEDIPTIYSDWTWLINSDDLKTPLLMTSFGDLFFKAANGAVYFLDTIEGEVVPFVKSEDEFEAKLANPEVQDLFLSSEYVKQLRERGLVLKHDELYIYVPHPIIAKDIVLDSVQVMSMAVVVSLNGQLLQQIITR